MEEDQCRAGSTHFLLCSDPFSLAAVTSLPDCNAYMVGPPPQAPAHSGLQSALFSPGAIMVPIAASLSASISLVGSLTLLTCLRKGLSLKSLEPSKLASVSCQKPHCQDTFYMCS